MKRFPAFCVFDIGLGSKSVMSCLKCNDLIEDCRCVWSAVRKLQEDISQCVDVKMIHREIQSRECWQKGNEVLIADLMKRIDRIEQWTRDFAERYNNAPSPLMEWLNDPNTPYEPINESLKEDLASQHSAAQFWFTQADKLKAQVGFLEKCLQEKNQKIAELERWGHDQGCHL